MAAEKRNDRINPYSQQVPGQRGGLQEQLTQTGAERRFLEPGLGVQRRRRCGAQQRRVKLGAVALQAKQC